MANFWLWLAFALIVTESLEVSFLKKRIEKLERAAGTTEGK